jgi:hypothetical protein
MSFDQVVNHLSDTDDLENWQSVVAFLSENEKLETFKQARPLWLERMVVSGKVLLHPLVTEELRVRGWEPTEIHDRMIWANILVSKSGNNSKEDFKRIKNKIIRKHGHNWWEDVYRRIKPIYAARQRLIKQEISPAIQILATHSSLVTQAAEEQRISLLEMIPRH